MNTIDQINSDLFLATTKQHNSFPHRIFVNLCRSNCFQMYEVWGILRVSVLVIRSLFPDGSVLADIQQGSCVNDYWWIANAGSRVKKIFRYSLLLHGNSELRRVMIANHGHLPILTYRFAPTQLVIRATWYLLQRLMQCPLVSRSIIAKCLVRRTKYYYYFRVFHQTHI